MIQQTRHITPHPTPPAPPNPPAPSGSGRAHVAVVGGGLAGLAAAAELLTLGFRVTLLEKNHHLGGKMNVLDEAGYRFDMGPTIITLPNVLRGILRRAGRDPAREIDLVDLDPQWRCFYPDGAALDLRKDLGEMCRALDDRFPGTDAGAGYRAFIEYSRRMFRLSENVFFYRDLGGIPDLMRDPPTRDPAVMRDVRAMRLHSTVGATAHKHIKEPHLAQLVEHFLQYVGSSPFLAPAILSLIAAAQVDHGCWYPMGGTRQVARALERLIREHPFADVRTGARVERFETSNGSVSAVLLEGGDRVDTDYVVSNCDVQRTYRDLAPSGDRGVEPEARSIAKRYEPACSGVVLYLGLDRQYDHLAHHNFLFSGSSKEEFGDIYRRGIPARDPTLYLAAPSRTDPDQAPPGGEALYVLIHTAYKRAHQTWDGPGGLLEQYRPTVMNTLKTTGRMPDIEDRIVVEKHLTPDTIDRLYNAEGGAIYGLASHGRLHGGFKPRNSSRVYGNLFLAGGSANPGPGVPMVLMSGVTAALSLARRAGVDVEQARYHVRDEDAGSCATQAMGVGS